MSATVDSLLESGDWLSAIKPGHEYYWKRTDGWDWFGTPHWWEIFVVFHDGFHGGGGAIIYERWRWNGSAENIRQDQRHLSYGETVALVAELLTQATRPTAPKTALSK